MFVLIAVILSQGTGYAQKIQWPEAVSRLAGERAKAETCVALLKQHGNAAQISNRQLSYSNAKSKIDSVIAGLITALAERGAPENLPNLNAKLNAGATELGLFCQSVNKMLPNTDGKKGVLIDIAKAAIEPVINALSDGVAALYNDYRDAHALTRATITTQLEATRWPAFKDIKAAQ